MNRKKQKGQGLMEYLVLVSLIAISSIAVVSLVGTNIKELYANVSQSLNGRSKVSVTEVKKSDYQRRWMNDFTESAKE